MKIGIFGGAFNPPHIAHAIVAESVRQQLSLDRLLFIPSGNPPLKESDDALHRFEMAKLAFADNPNFEVSDIEMKRSGKSFTVDTLERLREFYYGKSAKLYLIVGADNLLQFPKWKDPHRLFELAEVVVINRPEYVITESESEFARKVKFVTVPYLEISSSMIRKKVSAGETVRYLVDSKVETYIAENNLYKTS